MTVEIVAPAVSVPLIEVVKPIRLSKHALDYAKKRGFTVAEVEETIRTSSWHAAELGRLDCRKDFAYGKEWNGRVCATKQVRPVFAEEAAEIVVITVYTYYF
jgi:hypothetical protein